MSTSENLFAFLSQFWTKTWEWKSSYDSSSFESSYLHDNRWGVFIPILQMKLSRHREYLVETSEALEGSWDIYRAAWSRFFWYSAFRHTKIWCVLLQSWGRCLVVASEDLFLCLGLQGFLCLIELDGIRFGEWGEVIWAGSAIRLDDVILPLLSAGSGIGLEWLMHLEREQGV